MCGLLCAVAWLAAPAQAAQAAGRVFGGVVSHVSDGDTLWVRPDAGGPPRKIRLHGIDAPELCQAGGPAAREALRLLALDQPVRVSVLRRDSYQRALARVTRRGEDLAGLLVRQGQAWSYRFRDQAGPYAREERAARQAGRGLFAAARPQAPGGPEHPRDFRRRHGPCESG